MRCWTSLEAVGFCSQGSSSESDEKEARLSAAALACGLSGSSSSRLRSAAAFWEAAAEGTRRGLAADSDFFFAHPSSGACESVEGTAASRGEASLLLRGGFGTEAEAVFSPSPALLLLASVEGAGPAGGRRCCGVRETLAGRGVAAALEVSSRDCLEARGPARSVSFSDASSVGAPRETAQGEETEGAAGGRLSVDDWRLLVEDGAAAASAERSFSTAGSWPGLDGAFFFFAAKEEETFAFFGCVSLRGAEAEVVGCLEAAEEGRRALGAPGCEEVLSAEQPVPPGFALQTELPGAEEEEAADGRGGFVCWLFRERLRVPRAASASVPERSELAEDELVAPLLDLPASSLSLLDEQLLEEIVWAGGGCCG